MGCASVAGALPGAAAGVSAAAASFCMSAASAFSSYRFEFCKFTLLFLLLMAIADWPHRDADAGASFVHSSAVDLRWCVDFGISLCQSRQTSL